MVYVYASGRIVAQPFVEECGVSSVCVCVWHVWLAASGEGLSEGSYR